MQYFLYGFLIYGVIVNGSAYIMMWLDKRRARTGKGHRRIPEKVLWQLVFVGGSFGLWLGMKHFRHKTQKTAFRIGVPSVLIAQAALIVTAVWLGHG